MSTQAVQNILGKKISEIKVTCKACGNIYFYGKSDAAENFANQVYNFGANLENASSSAMCCGGCLPAAFIPQSKTKKTIDLNRCQKCGSRSITKERVTHEV